MKRSKLLTSIGLIGIITTAVLARPHMMYFLTHGFSPETIQRRDEKYLTEIREHSDTFIEANIRLEKNLTEDNAHIAYKESSDLYNSITSRDITLRHDSIETQSAIIANFISDSEIYGILLDRVNDNQNKPFKDDYKKAVQRRINNTKRLVIDKIQTEGNRSYNKP